MKMRILIAACISIAAAAFLIYQPRAHPPTSAGDSRVLRTPSGEAISLAVADTDAARELGLGGRASMPDDEGMLFVFPEAGHYPFWMKGMEFPLDIVWVDSNWKVVYLKPDIATSTYPEFFVPQTQAQYVIELNAGAAARAGIREGSVLRIE